MLSSTVQVLFINKTQMNAKLNDIKCIRRECLFAPMANGNDDSNLAVMSDVYMLILYDNTT